MPVKISQLPANSALNGTELLAIVQGGTTKQATVSEVADSGSVTSLDDLSDVDLTTAAPVSGDVLEYDGTDWAPVTKSVDFEVFVKGKPGASELVSQVVMSRATDLPSGLTDSQGYVLTAPADAAADFDVQKNGVSVGTVSFAQSSNTATFTMASVTSFIAGDRLSVVAPGTQDSAMADVSITLAGTR